MIQSKTIYTTKDGKEFEDKDKAHAHQGAIDMAGRIHFFASSKYPGNSTAAKKAANIILEWEEWERLADKGLILLPGQDEPAEAA